MANRPPSKQIATFNLMKMRSRLWFFLALLFSACGKDKSTAPAPDGALSYGNNVFYLRTEDYSITPTSTGNGTYSAFPDNLNINPNTGAITISVKDKDGKNTQTGLKYKIYYTSATGKKDSTLITIAGINYQDKIYYLSKNDTIANAIYNGAEGNSFPGGNFTRSNGKLDINPSTGAINLASSLRNGLFNDDPQNSDWRVVNVEYTTNDASGAKKNNLDVVVYFYDTLEDIPSNVSGAMRAHQDLLIGISPANIPVTNAPVDNDIKNIVSASKPRPPCIIIIK